MENKVKPNLKKNLPSKSLIERLEDPKLKETVIFLKNSRKIVFDSGTQEFKDSQEVEEFFKEKIRDWLHQKLSEICEKLSEIRKQNIKDTKVINFKLMTIPLKIKVFLATNSLKDLENILKKMDEIKKELIIK